MNASETDSTIKSLEDKISSYKALLSFNHEMYDGLQARIITLCLEIASDNFDVNCGTDINPPVSNKYIKCSVVAGLKQKALRLLEDNVVLEFMIAERMGQLSNLKENCEGNISSEHK